MKQEDVKKWVEEQQKHQENKKPGAITENQGQPPSEEKLKWQSEEHEKEHEKMLMRKNRARNNKGNHL